VYKFDRLGRSLSDLLSIISELHEKGVEIMSLKDNIDTSSVSGKLMMHIFASLAEFERDLIVERTQAGRKAAMAKGKKMGRPKLKRNKKAKATAMLYEKNLSIDQIQEQLGIRSKSTVYRYLRMEGFEPTRKIYLRKTKKS
jgi:DNA invertase Pin-like site-specific DNA recombinase